VVSNAIRGRRVGSGPIRPDEAIKPVPRQRIRYWCANGHLIEPSFAADADAPSMWDCPHCGLPAGLDPMSPPRRPEATPYKSHLAYVKERRTDAEGAALVAEALAHLRQRRGE
jgi:hypothetical protein